MTKPIKDQIESWLDNLIGEIPHGASTVTGVCETGDRVVTICPSRGGDPIKPEGKGARQWRTPDAAWYEWRDAFGTYREGKSGLIYWRQEPQLTSCECGMSHYISARLFIAEE